MAVVGRKIVVFGGCHDDLKRAPKYFNDVHVFDTDERTWAKLKFPTTMMQPDPRSGCQLAPLPGGVILYGGYTSVPVKGEVFRGVVHTDAWQLSEPVASAAAAASPGAAAGAVVVAPTAAAAAAAAATGWTWAKVKTTGAPSMRASATMTARGLAAFSFGGVCDEETEESLKGQFFDELYSCVCIQHPRRARQCPNIFLSKAQSGNAQVASGPAQDADGPLRGRRCCCRRRRRRRYRGCCCGGGDCGCCSSGGSQL
jgi:hypothetical protein